MNFQLNFCNNSNYERLVYLFMMNISNDDDNNNKRYRTLYVK